MASDPETLTALGGLTSAITTLTQHLTKSGANAYTPYTGYSNQQAGVLPSLGAQVGGAVGGQAGAGLGGMLGQMIGMSNPQLFGQLSGGWYQNSYYSAITRDTMSRMMTDRTASLATAGISPGMSMVFDMIGGAGTTDKIATLRDYKHISMQAIQQGSMTDRFMVNQGMDLSHGGSMLGRVKAAQDAGQLTGILGNDAASAFSYASIYGRGSLEARSALGVTLANTAGRLAGIAFGGDSDAAMRYLQSSTGKLSGSHLAHAESQIAKIASLSLNTGTAPEEAMQMAQVIAARTGGGDAGGREGAINALTATAYMGGRSAFGSAEGFSRGLGLMSSLETNLGTTMERKVLNTLAAAGDKAGLAAYKRDPTGFSQRYMRDNALLVSQLGDNQEAGAESGAADVASGATLSRELGALGGSAGGAAFVRALERASPDELADATKGKGRLAVLGVNAGLNIGNIQHYAGAEALIKGRRSGVGDQAARDIQAAAGRDLKGHPEGPLNSEISELLSKGAGLMELFKVLLGHAGVLLKDKMSQQGNAPSPRSGES